MSEPIIVIPARWQSARFPGKPLVPIFGATGIGKPLIQRTWEVAKATGFRVVIATDDARIAEAAIAFGAEVFESSVTVHNGTERCALFAAYTQLPRDTRIINLQGDACLTPASWLMAIAEEMALAHGPHVATMVTALGLAHMSRPEVPDSSVIAYTSTYGLAYYFGRERHGHRHHILGAQAHFGVYGYTAGALEEYMAAGQSSLEAMEDLEQNRWLALGTPIRAVWPPDDEKRIPLTEVNTPEDVYEVQRELAKWEIE